MDQRDRTAELAAEVAELKRQLAESRGRLDALLDGSGDGIFMIDTGGRFLFVNELIARNSGFPAAAFVGRHFLDLIREEDRAMVRENFERAIAGEAVHAYELAYRTADGELMWVELSSAPVVADGVVSGVIGITRNIQKRKAFELALSESEQKYRSLVETLPHIIAILQDERIVFANAAARRVLGVDPVEDPRPLHLFAAPSQRERIAEMLRRRAQGDDLPVRYRTTIVTGAGDEIPIEVYVQPTQFRGQPAVQCVAIDLSENQRLEEQIQQIQKMEALGTLAGGVAHDFNNLLVAILATADLLKRKSTAGSDVRRAADTIERAAKRAAGLTQQLLGFARKARSERAPVDLHTLIDEVCEILERTVGKEIALVRAFEGDCPLALGEPGQLQQILINLAVNARDAMPGGGELTIATRCVELTDGDLLATYELASGEYLEVSVSDTGRGIPADVRARMFEPFFTTKPQGKGSGMGLAVVYGIVRSHHGAIRVDSAPGKGTRFSIYLPVAPEGTPRPEPPSKVPQRGCGTVMVVDDEELPRGAARAVLESLGYTVVDCASGAEAIELVRTRGAEIDLAFIDVSMPSMNGWQCLRQLRSVDPALEVIMTSGYGREAHPDEVDRSVELLPKPYAVEQLASAVARHLERSQPRRA